MRGNLHKTFGYAKGTPTANKLVEVEGTEELKKAITKYANSWDYKERRKLVKRALKPYRKALEADMPKSRASGLRAKPEKSLKPGNGVYNPPGALKKSAKSWTRGKSKTTVFTGVRFKYRSKGTKSDVFYAMWVMFGFTHVAWPEKNKTIRKFDYPKNRLKWIPGKNSVANVWNRLSGTVERNLIKELAAEHLKNAKKAQLATKP